MYYKETTQVPNAVFDIHLPGLSLASLKVLLIIIRGTYGWYNKKTGRRKERDRITIRQFIKKTGLSRRSVCSAIQTLFEKQFIQVSDFKGKNLTCPNERKGKSYLYYALKPVQITTATSANTIQQRVQKRHYNKTNNQKINDTKEMEYNMKPIKEFLSPL
ncbi:MAG: hypothetical protein AB7P01_14590 [Bacteroidia bacterium]